MPLSPKEMGEAILQNLPSKTGKSISTWIEIITKISPQEKQSIVKVLKQEHGLGHFQAIKLYETYQNTDDYSNEESLIKNLIKNEKLESLYKAISSQIMSLGADIKIRPCKNYIPFYRKHQFVSLVPNGKDKITVSLKLPQNEDIKEFIEVPTQGSTNLTHGVLIQNQADVNNSLLELIEQAYQNQ